MYVMDLTYKQYLTKLAVIVICYLTFPLGFAWCANASTLMSYLGSVVCFLLLTIVSASLFFNDRQIKRFYIISFIFLQCIGLFHFLFFIDPNYFSGKGQPNSLFWHEYLTTFDAIEKMVYGKINNGFFYLISEQEFATTHIEIYNYISMPFISLGVKWLNFAPLNTFSSLVASMNLLLFAQRRNLDKDIQKLVMLCGAFFPLFLLSDTIWRDPFGLALISCALVLCELSEYRGIKFAFSFILLLYCGYILRIMYPVVILLGYGLYVLKKKDVGGSKYILFLLFSIACFVLFNNISTENDGYAEGYTRGVTIMSLPVHLLFCIVGAFPWTTFLAYNVTPTAAYYLSDYVQGIFVVACFWAFFSNAKTFKITSEDFATIVGFGIMLTGIVSRSSHAGYLTEGVFFALPWLFNYVGPKFPRYLKYSFLFLLIANIVAISVGGHLGIASFLR